MSHIAHILVATILYGSLPVGQEPNPTGIVEPRWKQLSTAYCFVLGQDKSLGMIGSTFPDLQRQTAEAQALFALSAFGEGHTGVRLELEQVLGEKWKEYETEIGTQVASTVGAQSITREQALAFIEEVKARAAGKLPAGVDAMLLSANPRYLANPALELVEGHTKVFKTDGHQKAKNIKMSTQIPLSWTLQEGNRPNVVQTFQSGAGHGDLFGSVLIKDLGLKPGQQMSDKELAEFFSAPELAAMVPPGGKMISAKSIVIEGRPAGMLVYDITQQRLDVEMRARTTQFITVDRGMMIFLTFFFQVDGMKRDEVDRCHERYLAAFKGIANTMVFTSRYGQ